MSAPKLPSRAKRIAHIQQRTDEVVRLGAIGVSMIGGPAAVDGYLSDALCNLLGVAIAERGKAQACELMAAGLLVAESYTG